MKALLTFFYLSAAALVFGAESTVLYRQTVNVQALSNGIEKTIYSTVGKEKVENQLTLIVTALHHFARGNNTKRRRRIHH